MTKVLEGTASAC